MTIVVDIALAIICFSSQPGEEPTCRNALIGSDTPRGTYTLQQRLVDDPLYGGDVLQFREDPSEVYAIHRVWNGRPYEKRDQRIRSKKASDRRVTKGCINVTNETYDELVNCCSTDTLIVK